MLEGFVAFDVGVELPSKIHDEFKNSPEVLFEKSIQSFKQRISFDASNAASSNVLPPLVAPGVGGIPPFCQIAPPSQVRKAVNPELLDCVIKGSKAGFVASRLMVIEAQSPIGFVVNEGVWANCPVPQ